MASKFLLTSKEFRPELVLTRPVHTNSGANLTTVAGSSTQTYNVDLPPGSYELMMFVKSNVTGTTTTIGSVRAYVDDQVTVNNQDLSVVAPNDAQVSVKSVTFPAGAAGKIFQVQPTSAIGASPYPVLPRGLRFTVTKGGAATGEQFEVQVLALRRAG